MIPDWIHDVTLVLCVIVSAACITVVLINALSFFLGGAPFIATPLRVVLHMLNLAELRPGETVVDLGCGDGRLPIIANRTWGTHSVGVEISPLIYLLAAFNVWIRRAEVKLVRADIFQFDFSDADVVFCYLFPDQVENLKKRFERLKPGCRIISHQFEIPGWQPSQTICIEKKSKKIFIYKYVVKDPGVTDSPDKNAASPLPQI
jgi:SAM-dependent methyltransferase